MLEDDERMYQTNISNSFLQIQSSRLERNILDLGEIGLNDKGGLDRTTFTKAEIMARNWLKDQLNNLGLKVRVDPAANIWARRDGTISTLPVIAFGSHIDTVPNGGKFDGALGVLIALEVMQILEEKGMKTRHPLELVSFSAEEPNPFGLSTFGSRAVAGKLKVQDIKGIYDDHETQLTEALHLAGGDPERFEEARRNPDELVAYLEVHIEQGKRLLNKNIPVGVVTTITGIYREEVTIYGEANHAGTTIMGDRKDALMKSAEIMLAFEEVCRQHPSEEVVGTIGKITNYPNAANIIPEKVVLHLEIRGKTQEDIMQVKEAWEIRVDGINQRRQGKIERQLILNQAPESMDSNIINVCLERVQSLGYNSMLLGSMAGHDATHMASLTRTGMLFVPSLGGKSHCPEEKSRMIDIEKVANVLLHTILYLDEQLNKEKQ